MKKQTNTDLRRKLREQRAAYEELLGLSGAILAALCVRCGDGATLRLPKQAVHDALETYEFAAAADGAHGCARRPWKKTRRMVHEKADEHRPAAKAARAARGV